MSEDVALTLGMTQTCWLIISCPGRGGSNANDILPRPCLQGNRTTDFNGSLAQCATWLPSWPYGVVTYVQVEIRARKMDQLISTATNDFRFEGSIFLFCQNSRMRSLEGIAKG